MSTMTAEVAEIHVTPQERSLLRRCADMFRNATRRVVSLAKRGWGWIKRQAKNLLQLKPVRWAWDKAVSAGKWAWSWLKPAGAAIATGAKRAVLSPITWAATAVAGLFSGSFIVTTLVSLGLVAGIGLLIAGTVVLMGAADTDGAERFVDTLEKRREERGPSPVEQAEEITKEMAENGEGVHYTVKIPTDLKLDPHETIQDRVAVLDELAHQAEANNEHELVAEIGGRMNLLQARAGAKRKIKNDAPVSVIHKDYRLKLESLEGIGDQYNWMAAYRGAQAEDARLTKIRELKAQHDKLQTT